MVANIFVRRMLIEVIRIIRMVPMMVARVLKIQAMMTVATSVASDENQYGGSKFCTGNQYGGHKLGVGANILVCRMLIEVMRVMRMVPMMVARVLQIQATMTVATSKASEENQYGGSKFCD